MTPDRIEAVIRTTEIFKKRIRPGQPVIYLAEASGPIEGRSFADLDKLTYTVGMGGESEILTFRETVALFDWLFSCLLSLINRRLFCGRGQFRQRNSS